VTLCGALFVVYDLVSLKYIIQNKERGPLAKPWMIYTVLILWAVYFIVRNVLLFFGIDLIGDVRADLLGM
jgi:small neutral amino acid transporter SnatA (MarC family)